MLLIGADGACRGYIQFVLLILLLIFIALFIALPMIGLAAWALVSVAIVGLIIGGLARLVLPGHQNIGIIGTVLLGWIGSIIGSFIGFHVLAAGWLVTVLLEIAVAAVLIGLYAGGNLGRHPGLFHRTRGPALFR